MSTTWIERFTSDYAKENGYIDYGAIAKAIKQETGGLLLANTLVPMLLEDGFEEVYSGSWDRYFNEEGDEITFEEACEDDNSTQEYIEVYQWFLINETAAEILREFDEFVVYLDDCDIFAWGVQHYGTSWDYVLTDVKIKGE